MLVVRARQRRCRRPAEFRLPGHGVRRFAWPVPGTAKYVTIHPGGAQGSDLLRELEKRPLVSGNLRRCKRHPDLRDKANPVLRTERAAGISGRWLPSVVSRSDAAIATAKSTSSRVDEINDPSSDRRYKI